MTASINGKKPVFDLEGVKKQLKEDLQPCDNQITRKTVEAAKVLFQKIKELEISSSSPSDSTKFTDELEELKTLADNVMEAVIQTTTKPGLIPYLERVASAMKNFVLSLLHGHCEPISSQYLLLRSLSPDQVEFLCEELLVKAKPIQTRGELTHIIEDIRGTFLKDPLPGHLVERGFKPENVNKIAHVLKVIEWVIGSGDQDSNRPHRDKMRKARGEILSSYFNRLAKKESKRV